MRVGSRNLAADQSLLSAAAAVHESANRTGAGGAGGSKRRRVEAYQDDGAGAEASVDASASRAAVAVNRRRAVVLADTDRSWHSAFDEFGLTVASAWGIFGCFVAINRV